MTRAVAGVKCTRGIKRHHTAPQGRAALVPPFLPDPFPLGAPAGPQTNPDARLCSSNVTAAAGQGANYTRDHGKGGFKEVPKLKVRTTA